MSSILPTLSLWEPWASLIAAGFKQHETRHWPTRVRGQIAIHAAKRIDVRGAPGALCDFALGEDWTRNRPIGCVVAVAQLVDCIPTEDLLSVATEADQLAGNFEPERFGFLLKDVRPLRDPLPLIGRQGFFAWRAPADLEARLGPPVGHLRQARRWEERWG